MAKKLMVDQPHHMGDEVIQPGTLYDPGEDLPDGISVREVDTDDFPAEPGWSQPEYSPGANPHYDGTDPGEEPAKAAAPDADDGDEGEDAEPAKAEPAKAEPAKATHDKDATSAARRTDGYPPSRGGGKASGKT
jgi:hypothetical protein